MKNKNITIIDCYTDEPSGLGVPPFLGTYPRYIFGSLKLNKDLKEQKTSYLTIDDLRLLYNQINNEKNNKKNNSNIKEITQGIKTNIFTYNLTRSIEETVQILNNTFAYIFIIGVLTPGKYLRAVPGTFNEVKKIFDAFESNNSNNNSKNNSNILKTNPKENLKILFGPLTFGFGSSNIGGRRLQDKYKSSERIKGFFDIIVEKETYEFFEKYDFLNQKKEIIIKQESSYNYIDKISTLGSEIINQIPWETIVELETSRGCNKAIPCSFCVEKLKHKLEFREPRGIIREAESFAKKGIKHFRLGKQSSFYNYFNNDVKKIEYLLKGIHSLNPETFHIDNVNPKDVIKENGEKITKLIVKYCTSGNVAAFGVESLDPKVIELNNLKVNEEELLKAIKIINKYGSERGKSGLPNFLPGLNFIFGLIGETKQSFQYTYEFLMKLLDSELLIRRVNIREVVPYYGTILYQKAGDKYFKKNRRYYYTWRKKIREDFDYNMLQKIVPKGTILKDCLAEIHDGNTTFLRQFGTYPLIIGVKERLELKRKYDVVVQDYMLRSIIGSISNH